MPVSPDISNLDSLDSEELLELLKNGGLSRADKNIAFEQYQRLWAMDNEKLMDWAQQKKDSVETS